MPGVTASGAVWQVYTVTNSNVRASGAGTLGHTGCYAVANRRLTGEDPLQFNSVTAFYRINVWMD